MLKKLFSIYYSDKLILEMLEATNVGVLVSNILAPLLAISLLHSYIPHYVLSLWFFLHIFTGIFKIIIKNKLKESLTDKKTNRYQYINFYTFTTTVTGFLFGMLSYLCFAYDAPELIIILLGSGIVILSSASIVTLGSVFIAFLGFIVFITLPYIYTLLYYGGGQIFNVYAISLIIYLFVFITYGYRLFLTRQKAIEHEEKFKTIFNKSSDGIAIIKNNKIIESNEAFIKIFGFENGKDAFFTTTLLKLIPPKQPDGMSSIRKMLLKMKEAREKTITFEWQHTKPNGDIFWVDITLSSIYISQELVTHGIWRDITTRKMAQQEIKNLNTSLKSKVKIEIEKNRLKEQQIIQQSRLAQMGEMISMIAHQWRQPLTAISSTASSVNLKAQLNKLDKNIAIKLSNNIIEYSQHLSSTIDDFRDFFKSDKEMKAITYNKLLSDVINIIEGSLASNGVELIQKQDSNLILTTYANEIKQVILNLIKNAEDALIENKIRNPRINIETHHNILTINDNAGGIPKDIMEKIFDPYFSTKTKKDGTGLGLYMSKTIIEEHCGGKLSAFNDKNGAIFTIELPITKS